MVYFSYNFDSESRRLMHAANTMSVQLATDTKTCKAISFCNWIGFSFTSNKVWIKRCVFCWFKIELDKTAEEFRKAHHDRQGLIRQWEVTIEQMQRRDREMDQAALVSHLSCLNKKSVKHAIFFRCLRSYLQKRHRHCDFAPLPTYAYYCRGKAGWYHGCQRNQAISIFLKMCVYKSNSQLLHTFTVFKEYMKIFCTFLVNHSKTQLKIITTASNFSRQMFYHLFAISTLCFLTKYFQVVLRKTLLGLIAGFPHTNFY